MPETSEGVKVRVGEAIKESVRYQRPSRRNVLSRFIGERLAPTPKPKYTPPLIIEEPPQTEEPEIETPLTPEQVLKEKSKRVIAQLDELNKVSLSSGNERIGYRIGADEKEIFILSQPVDHDVVEYHDYRKENITHRYHHYVIFTREGIQSLWFHKGSVDEAGKLDLSSNDGQTFDERYEGSERAFIIKLSEYANIWEDETGNRKETAHLYGPNERPTPYWISGFEGLVKDEKGMEWIILGSNARSWNSGSEFGKSPYGLSLEVPADIVAEAVQKSRESARTVREVSQTPTDAQIQTLDSVLSSLEQP